MVFLDIGMPGMDGYEVARRMRQQPGLEKVVLAALTGWGQQEDRRRTAEAGFDHHLVKPPEPKAVEGVLAELKSARGIGDSTRYGVMPAKNDDLHGNAPDKSDVALLLIDVINDLEFPEADQLLPHALPMARQIAALKGRARQEGVPVVNAHGRATGCEPKKRGRVCYEP